MSLSWNAMHGDEAGFMYLVGSETTFLFTAKTWSMNIIPKVLSDLETAGVPVSYTKGVRSIKFTRIPSGRLGTYALGKINISVFANCDIPLAKLIVHELAHHLDDMEDIVSDPKLIREKKTRAKYLDPYARRNVDEYFAVGVEEYYFGDRKKLSKNNPVLYKKISKIHHKYREL